MGWRYCPSCERWLKTSEYTVSKSGETICPDHEIATHGFIIGRMTEAELRNSHVIDDEELEAAKKQGLI
jgi:hypothetical protein